MNSPSAADLVAALRLQQEWGADDILEDAPWSPLAPIGAFVPRASTPARFPDSENRSSARPVNRFASARSDAPLGPSAASEGVTQTSLEPQNLGAESLEAQILGARDFQELAERARQIDGLSLARTAMHPLGPVYVENAPFLLIGEVPDADEDRSGQLFAGETGKLLDRILASIGLTRAQISQAPAIPWRPPGGRPLSLREREAALPILQRSIALCRPPRLVTMGLMPAMLLLGGAPRLSQIRGKWTEVTIPGLDAPVPLLPTLHPLQLSGGPTLRKNLWKDMLLLANALES